MSRGTSRDRGLCPGTFAPALVPGQRDNGTSSKSCHGTGQDGIFDMLSRPVPGRHGTITKWRMTDRPTKKDAKGIQKLMMYHKMIYHIQCGLSIMYHDPGQTWDRRKMSKRMHFLTIFDLFLVFFLRILSRGTSREGTVSKNPVLSRPVARF